MLLETGRVVAVDADAVWVETVRKTTCGSCAAQKGCGHGLINQLVPGRHPLVRALPGKLALDECQVDDEVQISIPEAVLLRGSLVVYVLPLVSMLAGAALAAATLPGNPDSMSALGAVAGLAAGFVLVRWHARQHRNDRLLQPTLVSIHRHSAQSVKVS